LAHDNCLHDSSNPPQASQAAKLFTENHRLRFLINVDNAHKAGLRISSDLLKLAAGVRQE
jgi:hypothetical protein